MALLIGVYVGGAFGGSIPAILFGTPGAPEASVTSFDGYPMMKKGLGGKALKTALYASCAGNFLASLVTIFMMVGVSRLALMMDSPDYFGVVLFSIVLIATVGCRESWIKGLISVLLGLMFGLVGGDPLTGTLRFTFGNRYLMSGFSLIPVLIGLFVGAEVLSEAGKSQEEMSFILATGYGRNSLEEFADSQMSELSCHGKGAAFLFPEVSTVIDIGGQDVKVMRVENGVMTNFQMNDKCAAGTGRFLDVMARVLEVDVQDLGSLGAQSTKYVGISSTCTVFAESEVISQLSMGTDKRDIINGIHQSVASRVAGLAHRIGVQDQVVMTGGVAQNTGVVNALQEALGREIHTSPLTQYNGALGAALFAYQKYLKAQK